MALKPLIAGMSQDTQGAPGYTVPVGGMTDEVLSKASAADGNFTWLATSYGGDAQGDSGKLARFDPFGQLTGSTLNLTGYVLAGPSQQPARLVFGQDDWTIGSITLQGPQAPFSPGADLTLTLPHHGNGTFILDTSPSYSGNAATATLAATVITNANLTGHVVSTGNATLLGSFTIAQLNTAVSDADVAILGANTFTGTQTTGQSTAWTFSAAGGHLYQSGTSVSLYGASDGSNINLQNGTWFITNSSQNAKIDATSGKLTFSGACVWTPQAISGSGALTAINVTSLITTISTSGAATSTLAAGSSGQTKKLSMIADGGDCVVTITNASWGGAGTATFDDIYDTLTLEYLNSKWVPSANSGVTLA